MKPEDFKRYLNRLGPGAWRLDYEGNLQMDSEVWQSMNEVNSLPLPVTHHLVESSRAQKKRKGRYYIENGGLNQESRVLQNNDIGQRRLVHLLNELHRISLEDDAQVIETIKTDGSIRGERLG